MEHPFFPWMTDSLARGRRVGIHGSREKIMKVAWANGDAFFHGASVATKCGGSTFPRKIIDAFPWKKTQPNVPSSCWSEAGNFPWGALCKRNFFREPYVKEES